MSVTNLGPFPGEWCDCDWSPADGAFVFAALRRPGIVDVFRRADDPVTTELDSFDLGRWGLYLRAAADGQGNVCCVLQDGRDRNPTTGQFYPAIVVLFPKDGPPREIPCPAGPAFGQNAVEVWRGSGTFNFHVVVQTSPTTYWWGGLSQDGVDAQMWGWFDEMPNVPMAQTSQGFADELKRMDDVRASVPGMVCPSTADGLSIGQNTSGPDRIRGLHNGIYFTAIPGTAFEPHLASDGHGRWMACARTPQGAALVALAAPFVAEQPPPEPEPGLPEFPPNDDEWPRVPDGTPVTGALRLINGTHPLLDPAGSGIICRHKNVNDLEWVRVQGGQLRLWCDRSRFPGDPGWWVEPAPIWAFDSFFSGQPFKAPAGSRIIDLVPGKAPGPWVQTTTLYGLQNGGVCIQFDPRHPQDWGPSKMYERHSHTPSLKAGEPGRFRFEEWYSPGPGQADVLKRRLTVWSDIDRAPDPRGYVAPPRPLITPQEPEMPDTYTRTDVVGLIGDVPPDDAYIGARERFAAEVILPRDRVSDAKDWGGNPMNVRDMMTGGAAMIFDRGMRRGYLAARLDGAPRDVATAAGFFDAAADYRRVVGIDQAPGPPVTGPHPSPLVGKLRHSGRTFSDDTGPVLPVFLHTMDLLSRLSRGHSEFVDRTLDVAVRVGYHGCRILGCLGDGSPDDYWRGRNVRNTAELWQEMDRRLTARGLRMLLDAGDIWVNPDPFGVADMLNGMWQLASVAILGAGNETWQVGQPDPRILAQWHRHITWDCLRINSSPPDDGRELHDEWCVGGALRAAHSQSGDYSGNIRRIWNAAYEAGVHVQDEPRGNGRNVSVYNTVDHDTAILMAIAAASSGQFYTFMSSPGVISDGTRDGGFDGGEWFEDMPGFAAVPAAIARLPKDVASFKLVHGGDSKRGQRVFAVPRADDTRADHAIHPDGRFVVVVHGPSWREVAQERQTAQFEQFPCGERGWWGMGRL